MTESARVWESSLRRAQADWTVLGDADPLWAVLVDPSTRNGGWDRVEFLATGRAEVAGVLSHLDGVHLRPGRSDALDFGCGAGRLTQALAQHFDHVVGVDISPGMLRTARELDAENRCEFVDNVRPDLALFPDASFDLAYSSLVLQHLSPELGEHMLDELVRVTRPGGAVVVQVAQQPDNSVRGLLTRVLPRRAMRFAQHRVLRYPAPMEMNATPRSTVERVAGRWSARVADSVAEPMYGGHWRYTRYYLAR